MSQADNARNIAFSTSFGIDKIVRFYSGTYNRATDLTSVATVLAGFAWQYYVYRIPHDMGRPALCELIWSLNGTDFYDGGVEGRLAYADSNYIYIFDSQFAGVGTVTYRVYCSWLDDYNTTNPLLDTISYTNEPVLFDSLENIQKIASQTELSFAAGTAGSQSTQTITHSLGYTPNCKVWFEAFPGQVWPLNMGGSGNPFLASDSQDECSLAIYSDRVEVTMYRYSNAIKRAWVRIYYDAD